MAIQPNNFILPKILTLTVFYSSKNLNTMHLKSLLFDIVLLELSKEA